MKNLLTLLVLSVRSLAKAAQDVEAPVLKLVAFYILICHLLEVVSGVGPARPHDQADVVRALHDVQRQLERLEQPARVEPSCPTNVERPTRAAPPVATTETTPPDRTDGAPVHRYRPKR